MSNDGKRTPKLRFPDFRNDGDWKDAPLSDLCDRIIEKVGEVQLTPVSITAGRGYVSQAEKFGRDISGAQYKNYIHLRRGDFAYNKGNSNLYPQGCVYRLREFDEAAASNAFICFKLRRGNDAGFFEGLFEKNTHGRQLVRFLSSGARSDGLLNIKAEEFFSVQFPLPPRSAEQRKIADCLSSLDELIAAEGRKLESLRAYKKGLMQQLFPRPDETTSRLRFPEFRNAGAWNYQELGPKTIKVGSGITPTGGEKVYKKTGRPFIRSQNVGWSELLLDDVAYIDEETHQSFDGTELRVDDVLLNITGASIGRSAIADSWIAGGNVNQHVCIIRVKPNELSPVFLNQYLVSQDGQKQIDSFQAGGNRQGLNFAQIRSFLIPLPPTAEEQVRIAGCLSALDARLAAQSERLAALRSHKKGLMQQLFPSSAEDEE